MVAATASFLNILKLRLIGGIINLNNLAIIVMKNWIKERLNKDNFWNVMFWVGICLNIVLIEVTDSILLFLISLVLIPVSLTKINKVKYTEDNIFMTSSGRILNSIFPLQFSWVLAAMILLTAFVFVPFFIIPVVKVTGFIIATFVGFPLLILTLYFIYKNCPISILFNKKAWSPEVLGVEPNRGGTNSDYKPFKYNSSNNPYENPITSTRYSGCSWNIHNSNYNKR